MNKISKLFGVLGALALSACAEADITAVDDSSNIGPDQIGTLNAPLLRDYVTAHTPATENFDFTTVTQLTGLNYWVAFNAWVETADITAGTLNFQMTYTDTTGTSRLLNFGTQNLILSDSTSLIGGAVRAIQRETETAPWDLNTVLTGSAGTAEVGWLVTVTPDNPSDVSDFAYLP